MREEKSKHKILIVDDEKSNLDILRRLFRRKYQVLSAESGEDALDILAEHEVALILSDQRMPGITGAVLLERAMQTHPDAIRMILSGFTDTEDLIESINSGQVYRYVVKPWDSNDLQQTVDRSIETYELTIENRRLLSELQILNASLEQKIQERTVELQTAYDDLKQTQAMLVQTEKMATIGTMAGGIAHEINSPLAAILSNSQRILRFPDDEQKHIQSATLIEKATKQCKAIVESLLKYARKSEVETEEIDINAVIIETLSLVEHHLELKNIQIVKELSEVPSIRHSFVELSQVLTNLIMNAQDAISANDAEVGKIIISTAVADDKISLSVADNGIGMTQETQMKLFDPFFTTKDVSKGTGLGLSIVAGIVERFGGQIEVNSELGKGTTFIIRFSNKGES